MTTIPIEPCARQCTDAVCHRVVFEVPCKGFTALDVASGKRFIALARHGVVLTAENVLPWLQNPFDK